MKINPITARCCPVNYFNPRTKQNNTIPMHTNTQLVDKNYNQIAITFKGVPNTSLELIKQIPLEDRLASLFQNFKLGDLILIGKDMQECAKKMYNNAGLVKNAIKRSFFIADEKFGGNLGFIKNNTGDTEVINLNDKDLSLISNNKTYALKPEDNFYVVEGDILNYEGNILTIKNNPKADLSAFRKYFAKAFDYEKEVAPQIEKINKKTISQLMQNTRKTTSKVTFAQVGGLNELKDALKKDIIYPIRYPDAYENIELNHGFILYGPPGTGKTHIARALANEADANFISLNGLDLESKWVGESEANWRQLFNDAKENQPCVIFLDEFDAVARSRDSQDEYGNKVVNQILTLMTDIDNEGDDIFVIGATNNYKALDKAITRSGRFGKHYEVTPPDFDGLKEIFKINTKNKPLDDNIDVDGMLKKLLSSNATGADIRHIVNEAHTNGFVRSGIFAKMENKTYTKEDTKQFKITQADFDKALNDFLKDKKSNSRKTVGFGK